MRIRFGGTIIDTEKSNKRLVMVLVGVVLLVACVQVLLRSTSSSGEGQLGIPIDSALRARGVDRLGKGHLRKKRGLDAIHDDHDQVDYDDEKDDDKDDVLMPMNAESFNEEEKLDKMRSNEKPISVMEASGVDLNMIRRSHYQFVKNQNRAPDSRYNINVTHSDLLSPDRTVDDTRPPVCLKVHYDIASLPTVTVVMPFYNEALSMILRAVHSILSRSPDALLDQLILVDDKSTDKFLQDSLDEHLKLLPKVRIMHNPKRVGLVVSRMNGFRAAKSPIVVFIDAHTEVNVGWLEPLCDELKRNPKQILQPFIDGIDAMSLQYAPPGIWHKGSFSWDLRYTWIKMPDHEQAKINQTGTPFATPTMVGCAIAVNKAFFESFGAFDEALQVWGGENTELSFRTWMCGSRLMTVTCSRIGHVFKNFPYSFDGNKEEIVQKNLIRVAETWMDSLKKFFYASTRVYSFKRSVLNKEEQKTLDERKALRKKLKCKNFEWYDNFWYILYYFLQEAGGRASEILRRHKACTPIRFLYNVFPEMDIPRMDAIFYGEIMSIHSRACWEVTDDYYIGMTYMCYDHKIIPKNNFALTAEGLLRYRDKCVKISAPTPYLILSECPQDITDRNALENFGLWQLEKLDVVWGYLKVGRRSVQGHMEHWCIVQVTNAMPQHKGEQMPQLGACDKTDKFQQWSFTYGLDFSLVPQETLTHVSL